MSRGSIALTLASKSTKKAISSGFTPYLTDVGDADDINHPGGLGKLIVRED
jgi:hypothetical protein